MKQTVYLTTADLAERYRKSVRTIERWRAGRFGPPFIRVGRGYLYRLADVEKFDAEQFANTG